MRVHVPVDAFTLSHQYVAMLIIPCKDHFMLHFRSQFPVFIMHSSCMHGKLVTRPHNYPDFNPDKGHSLRYFSSDNLRIDCASHRDMAWSPCAEVNSSHTCTRGTKEPYKRNITYPYASYVERKLHPDRLLPRVLEEWIARWSSLL